MSARFVHYDEDCDKKKTVTFKKLVTVGEICPL